MLCETCLQIPLDLFLPHKAWGIYQDGKAWFGKEIVRRGEDCADQLRKSGEAGCHLCTIFWGALDAAEPAQLQGTTQQGREEKLQIEVEKEGEAIITDGDRIATVYWELESLNYGQKHLSVHNRVDCEENFALAKGWIQTCAQQHIACTGREPTFLPTRLIHVGNPTQGQPPRLVLTPHFPFPEHTQYLALSHCWGTDTGKTVPKTLRSTLPEYLEHIDTESLPKTFLDAMEVVRRLGHRYLWIDSLCIVQDDKEDFKAECSNMDFIFSEALCTIVAADSPDGDGGCFIPRNPLQVKPCVVTLKNLHRQYYPTCNIKSVSLKRFDNEPDEAQVTIYPCPGPWVRGIQRSAVSRRAWCLQEREMSPRVLHYTRDRLMWECRECTASEDKPDLESKKTTNESLAAHLSSFRLLDDESLRVVSKPPNRAHLKSYKWDMLVEAYSRRRLSVAADKLLAISGVARILAEHPGEYFAGIWQENLLKGLSWFPAKSRDLAPVPATSWPPAPVDAGIPSWSWAAYDGPITFVGDSWFTGGWSTIIGPDGKEKWVKGGPEIDVKSVSVTPSHNSMDTFGAVSGGELILEGWVGGLMLNEACLVAEADTPRPPQWSSKPPFPSKCYNVPGGDTSVITVFFDYDVAELPVNTTLLLLQLGTGISVTGWNAKVVTGLALMLAPPGSSRRVGMLSFRRVGMFEVAGDATAWNGTRRRDTVRIV